MQRIRPRFQLRVPYSPEEVSARFRQRTACAGCPCRLTALDRHLEVTIHDRLRHFWSPHLSVEVQPAEGGAELSGLFGPNPNVWTMFLACYAFLVLSAVFSALLGVSQLVAATGTPWGLWLAGAFALALVIPYVGSLIGQRLAAEQMEMLRCFLRASLELPGDGAPPPTCVEEGIAPESAAGKPLPTV